MKTMKQQYLIIFLSLVIFSSCETFENEGTYEDLQIVNDGDLVLDLSDIDYYDFSTHIVYLKENNKLAGDFDKLQGARVLVDGTEIYPLKIHEPYLSTFPVGPHINRFMDNFGDFAFRISYNSSQIGSGTGINDPRNDPRLIAVLKKHGKYRAGLSILLESMTRQENQVRFRIKLRNHDSQSYYHLDPKKMGEGLFHYFTNGLIFFDSQQMEYQYNKIQTEQPESFRYWNINWMSVIKGKETKTFEFLYPYDNVPIGQDLRFSFSFPSPELAITKKIELEQAKGRIWLGSVGVEMIKRF